MSYCPFAHWAVNRAIKVTLMQSIEHFMQALFHTRITEEKAILANRAPYRQRFCAPDCLWDSRKYTLKGLEL